jgi:site-specific recombinase XerD
MSVSFDRALAEYSVHLGSAKGYSPNTVKGYLADMHDLCASMSLEPNDSVTSLDLEILREWLWKVSEQVWPPNPRSWAKTALAEGRPHFAQGGFARKPATGL